MWCTKEEDSTDSFGEEQLLVAVKRLQIRLCMNYQLQKLSRRLTKIDLLKHKTAQRMAYKDEWAVLLLDGFSLGQQTLQKLVTEDIDV